MPSASVLEIPLDKAGTFFPRLTQMEESNCSYIQLKLYKAFQGMNQAEDLAIIGSARSTQEEEWVTILIQNCSVQVIQMQKDNLNTFSYPCFSLRSE